MPLFDLSLVTSTVTDVLLQNITRRLDKTLQGQLIVSTQPPERVTGAMYTLNLYLYHVAEDPFNRNLPGNLSERHPTPTTPLSLVLYYILTAHHELKSQFDTQTEQRLMGYALKTLHDFPVIGDDTQIDGTPVLNEQLRGGQNALEITLRPVTPEEALTFWNNENNLTTRLSAYYDVRYVQLEPERPRRLPGIVLSLGTYLVDVASPQLAGTMSRVTFALPAAAGGGKQTIEAAPARVGPPIVDDPDSNRLILVGRDLTIGQRRRVYLRNPRWRARDARLGRVLVDAELPANAAAGWSMAEAAGRIEITLGTRLTVALPDGPVSVPVEPGHYGVQVEVVKSVAVVAGRLKEVTDTSNETTFAVIPRVAGSRVVDVASRRIQIDVDPSVDLTLAAPGPLSITVVVDGEAYARGEPGAAGLAVGEYELQPNCLVLRARFDASVPGTHAFRLIVEGAESQPFWIEVP